MKYVLAYPDTNKERLKNIYKVDTSSFIIPMSQELNHRMNAFMFCGECLSYMVDLSDSEQAQFHTNWNWIHEVIEAIEKLPYLNVYFNKTSLGKHTIEISYETPSYKHQQNNKTIFVESINKKEAVVQAIDRFLIWYEKSISNS